MAVLPFLTNADAVMAETRLNHVITLFGGCHVLHAGYLDIHLPPSSPGFFIVKKYGFENIWQNGEDASSK
jgi:hypothetical protein